MVKTQNLTKRFGGVKAVDDLSVSIEQGKITGIIGPNGSGKTTLINLLSGMLAVDSGIVDINGVKLRKIRPHEIFCYGINRTFQNARLFEQMTVLDNILVVLTKKNIFSALFEKQNNYSSGHAQGKHLKNAEKVLKKVRLWEKRNQLAINLSYGQRKLLEIARVLVVDRKIFLLDEPFAGLFLEMRKIISSIILELKEKGKTIVLIEHNMDLIRELCDHVIVMDSGRLLTEGKTAQVLKKKKVIEAYLGE